MAASASLTVAVGRSGAVAAGFEDSVGVGHVREVSSGSVSRLMSVDGTVGVVAVEAGPETATATACTEFAPKRREGT